MVINLFLQFKLLYYKANVGEYKAWMYVMYVYQSRTHTCKGKNNNQTTQTHKVSVIKNGLNEYMHLSNYRK